MKNILFILLFTGALYGQKNSIYLESLGNGFFGSVNYERQLTRDQKLFVRAGIGFHSNLGILGDTEVRYTIPTSVNYLLSLNNNNYLDIGVGATLIESGFESLKAPNTILYLFTSIGFRRNFGGSFFWRIHGSPYVINMTKDTYTSGGDTLYVVEEFDFPKAWFGFSFGRRF